MNDARLESGPTAVAAGAADPTGTSAAASPAPHRPFAALARDIASRSVVRAAVTAATRRPEPGCVPPLIEAARLDPAREAQAGATARRLVEALRKRPKRGGVEGLVQEYSLSSQEGVALMCLAEALLRVPDTATRDALIRDKIGGGDWRSHLGHSPSLFVNAATWGLVVTGKLTGSVNETGLATALARLIAKGGEPLIRRGVDMAMRMMGEQFVTGQTIAEALAHARHREARGFRYSYDMLGEAALTMADADRYHAEYERAIHAIGAASGGRGVIEGPGISVKLSALHPRYSRAQRERVLGELLPRLKALTVLARRHDVGLNIDAEEADRLELSLDLLEALCFAPELAGWNGIGFVVQAYGKRAPAVIDALVDLARRSRHRLMVRLVKGAYWDSEIKRAQVDGLDGYPVFTRKVYTDLSYLACAKAMLAAPEAIFPQFATHNARTLAAIHAMAGAYAPGQYEFQCLHGMGEPLYDEVVGRDKLDRPCRIYAPVGTHETLLAYLVRRLLENGANSSFVNRIADPAVTVDDLIADPAALAAAIAPPGAPHPAIALPRDMFGPARPNASGLDLADEDALAALAGTLLAGAHAPLHATPLLAAGMPSSYDSPIAAAAQDEGGWSSPLMPSEADPRLPRAKRAREVGGESPAMPDVSKHEGPHGRRGEPSSAGATRDIRNPADRADRVGTVLDATADDARTALGRARAAAPGWAATPPGARAAILRRAADAFETAMPSLMGTLIREAGKSLPNAVGEVREAVDFLRYYANEAEALGARDPLGPVICISPWNFPLAIFTGQVAAALAAGNPVLAKPAEETPLVAFRAIRMLREAGVPPGVLQFLPGAGEVGAALVGDPRAAGVLFTGSTAVARLIQKQLAGRLNADGRPVPFVAETGGQNALVVDSSALPEQVVGDVLASAFDSAGQRCSALRVLCLQEDSADRVLAMLKGAMAELAVGNPDRLSTDVGPVITPEARDSIEGHVAAMRARGCAIHAAPLPEACRAGTFVAPTLIEIRDLGDLEREVFGPVLHVLRYRRNGLDGLIERINRSGFGLTFGLHTRIDETVARVVSRARAGNIYVNRNIIGAVVGVQPFGGNGLSGTGPKAGGPLYLRRLVRPAAGAAAADRFAGRPGESAALALADWLDKQGHGPEAAYAARAIARSPLGFEAELPGPVGERNVYALHPRGTVLVMAETAFGLYAGVAAALATGNRAAVAAPGAVHTLLAGLPRAVAERIAAAPDDWAAAGIAAVIYEGGRDGLAGVLTRLADQPGAVVPVCAVSPGGLGSGGDDFPLEALVEERTVSVNTAAAGGNATLMAMS